MPFLRERPIVSLTCSNEIDTFIADIVQPRPAFDEIARFSNAWSNQAAEKMQDTMKRKNCAVTWVQLVVDQHGVLVILRFGHPIILGAAKSAAKVILKCLPNRFGFNPFLVSCYIINKTIDFLMAVIIIPLILNLAL